ncbi:hypothetical protein CELD12_21280 [Cellulomonas sp. NTE-D12]|nr:hypothetical protein CELD12_21280 [Cellulomonas sp. NTE-D12]
MLGQAPLGAQMQGEVGLQEGALGRSRSDLCHVHMPTVTARPDSDKTRMGTLADRLGECDGNVRFRVDN